MMRSDCVSRPVVGYVASSLAALLAFGVVADAAPVTLLGPGIAGFDGGFEDPPGADRLESASWNDVGSNNVSGSAGGGFWSLNRSLGPGGPQEGSFSGVLNPGGRVEIQSNVISLTVNPNDVFDFTGYFAAQSASPGGDRSDYVLSLNFADGQGDIDLSALANTGADSANFTASPASGTTGTRVWLDMNPNAWNQFGHSYTYSGPGASQVQVTFEARPRSQTYFDNFTLIHNAAAIPEPGAFSMLAVLGGLVSFRRRSR